MTTIERLDDLGTIGMWTEATDDVDAATAASIARRAERAGFGGLWIREGLGKEALTHAGHLLSVTDKLPVATGIASIWARDPLAAHSGARLLREVHGDRFVLGLGVSHRLVAGDMRGHAYGHPVHALATYLDQMEALDTEQASGPRMIAALGPRMLDLAAEHHAGVITYLTTIEHTAEARRRLADGFLATELPFVLDSTEQGLRTAREHLATYLALENYVNSFRRLGFDESDLAEGGSDRLLDALIVRGSIENVQAAVHERLSAGADHVALHPLGTRSLDQLLEHRWRR